LRVLVVTQYYRPEVGATQNRMGAFVDGLAARGHDVTVLAEQPNHPAGVFQPGYGRRPLVSATEAGVRVKRLWVAASPVKTTTRRLAFYATFGLGAAAATLVERRPDVIFVTSPPLPGALAVAAAAKARRIPFVLDVRDLWPAAAQALGELSNPTALAAFERAERWVYRAAARVTATTEPFCRHIDSLASPGKAVHLPNGALDELLEVRAPAERASDGFTVGYAGNFGIAQGLGIVLDASEALSQRGVRFDLTGEGPIKAQFVAERDRRGLTEKVEVRPGAPLEEVAPRLAACDALLVPLRDEPVLQDFIPSKLYDWMALGRPVLVAARGEAPKLVTRTACGLVVAPEDGAGLAAAIGRLQDDPEGAGTMARAGREAARELVRSRQVENLEAVLQEASG
jgi:colanic acid biosynthesis glycosyl transferase WcaI